MIRDVAYELLLRVEQDDAYVNLVLPKLLNDSQVDSRDAGFIQELGFGAIRNRRLYELIIESASNREIASIELAARLVLLLGIHQLLAMRVPAHAAINETVNIAKRKASKSAIGFVNAVLRRVSEKSRGQWIGVITEGSKDIDQALSDEYSHPMWILKSLKSALAARGLESTLVELLNADNTPAKVSIVALPGFSTPDDFTEIGEVGGASPLGIEIHENPAAIEAVKKGFARVQDQGSQLAVLALAEVELAIADSHWLDVCAGPGGKAALLAALARSEKIGFTASEISEHRAKLVQNALKPITNVNVVRRDGREFGEQGPKFSRVLLDAPCTGLGALRRRPEARWRKQAGDIKDLSKLQRELFDSCWRSLLPGGVLAYVTCSPHLSETTNQVTWAMSRYGAELEVINANTTLNTINSNLDLDEGFLTAQLWPHTTGTDAMFIALFRKSLN
jgi:16S rRNA (cytosine967-C5)-methyltransferase